MMDLPLPVWSDINRTNRVQLLNLGYASLVFRIPIISHLEAEI